MEIRHKFSGYFQLPPEPFPFCRTGSKRVVFRMGTGIFHLSRGRKIPLSRAEQREDFPV